MQFSSSNILPGCRLGDKAFMVLLPPDIDPDDATPAYGEIEAHRTFASRHEGGSVVFADFTQAPGQAEQLVLHAGTARFAIVEVPTLQDFFAAGALGIKTQSAILKSLIGIVSRLFRLHRDQLYASLLGAFARQDHLPHASVPTYAIAGTSEAILCLPAGSGLTSGALVVALAETANPGEFSTIAPSFLGGEHAAHLAHAAFAFRLCDAGVMMAVDGTRILRLDAIAEASPDITHFYRTHNGRRPDVVAFLSRYGSADLVRELSLASLDEEDPPRPVELETLGFHFHAEIMESLDEGLFLSGWFHDPYGRLTSVDIVDFSLTDARLQNSWCTYHGMAEFDGKRVAVTGYCAWIERRHQGRSLASPGLVVTLDAGQSYICRAGERMQDPRVQRANLISVIHPDALDNGGLEKAFRPAMTAITQRLSPERSIRKTVEFGRKSERSVSVIIPLYRELGFIRSQILAFSVDPVFKRKCEVIYVVDDPALAGAVLHQIGGLSRMDGLDIRVVVLKGNCGFGPANNLGVGIAEGECLVLMNSDVVPSGPGWLECLQETLAELPEHSVVGPKLLYADDTVQHAGMYFFRLPNRLFQNMHYFKGYGRTFPAIDRKREVPAVTGALMMLAKASFAAIGGFDQDYVIGDYEDSDLCLKLREAGGIAFYQPQAELYHFERQSMTVKSDDTDSGSTLYNRSLHHSRWSGKIEELMMNPGFQDGRNVY